MSDDITLNADDAAALLHAESETILQYARSGELPGTRIGKSWVFMRDDVIAFLRKQISIDTEARQRRSTTTAPVAIVMQPKPSSRRRQPPLLPVTASKGVLDKDK
jgi:excisionase family DNA binding protein